MRDIELGFVALTDAAPLLVAHSRGLFEAEDLRVNLNREVSWATIRDKVAAGVYHGAHMLAPMALATQLGVGAEPTNLVVPMALNAHGATIGVSASLSRAMATTDAPSDADALARVIAQRRASGARLLSFAVVFPFSMHNYMLRYWAAAAGVDPDRDLHIVIASPTTVAARLRSGEVDGFAVGAPWGALCARDCDARIVLESSAFWTDGPDKVFAASAHWAKREPEALQALTRTLLRAALWADAPENAHALATLLAPYLDAPTDIIALHLGSGGAALRFARASFPWRSHAAWQLSQMMRWGQIRKTADLDRALEAYRPDLFRSAAATLPLLAPDTDSRIEHGFGDDTRFDPADAHRYAATFAISHVRD